MLDWRRLIERSNRSSPEPPRATFHLAEAPGQAVWPPPAAPVPLLAPPPQAGPVPSRQGSQRRPRALAPSAAASEAETLVSVRAARPPKAAVAGSSLALPSSKVLPAAEAVRAWQIHACYDPPAGEAAQAALLPRPAPIRTQPQQAARPPSREEAATLHAGSPTAKRLLSRWAASGTSPAAAAAGAAAAALPAAAVAERASSLAAELSDPLTTAEASLQLLAFEAESGCCAAGASADAPALPAQLHCTWRCLGSDPPTVTPPLLLQPAGFSAGGGGRQLFALVQDQAAAAAPEHDGFSTPQRLSEPEQLQLLDAAALERGAAELAAHGAPPSAGASLARQHRLRAARRLAQGRLQVDVWDSDSLLPLGTLCVPLQGLLRRGQPAAELVLRVPLEDASAAVQRLVGPDGGGGGSSGTALRSAPLRGSVLLRLACTGRQLPLPAGGEAGGGTCSWPSSPMRRHDGGSGGHPPAVVRARPALEDASGLLLRELARQEGVPEGVASERLPGEVVSRAAAKVQRLLALQGTLGSAAGGPTGAAGGGEADAAAVGQLVERRLHGEVEAARERCKRDAILRLLQAELPACLVGARPGMHAAPND